MTDQPMKDPPMKDPPMRDRQEMTTWATRAVNPVQVMTIARSATVPAAQSAVYA
jgi:hypothetical protein